MKKLEQISYKLIIALGFVFGLSSTSFAQNLDRTTVQQLIKSKQFVFKPETMLPLSGASKQLTSDYEMRLLGDTIVSYLPYFGRAYVADLSGEGTMDFTATKFDYKVSPRKKGGWDIDIRPKNAKDIRQLHFIVSENGYVTLQVTSDNHQAISYNGYIVPEKNKFRE